MIRAIPRFMCSAISAKLAPGRFGTFVFVVLSAAALLFTFSPRPGSAQFLPRPNENLEDVELTPGAVEYDASKQVLILEDATRQLDWSRALSELSAKRSGFHDQAVSYGFSKSAFWMLLRVRNPAARREYRLEFPVPRMERVTMYEITEGRVARTFESGLNVNFADRPIPHRHHVFPLSLDPGGTRDLLFRFESRTSTMSFPLLISERTAFERRDSRDSSFLGAFVGLLIGMMAYNLSLFLTLRDRSFLAYVLYVASFSICVITYKGLGGAYFWDYNSRWERLSLPLGLLISCSWLLIFTDIFFHPDVALKEQGRPFGSRLLRVSAALFFGFAGVLLVTALVWKSPEPFRATLFAPIITGIAILYVAQRRYPVRFGSSQYYWLAILCVFAGALVTAANVVGLLPNNALTRNGFLVGSGFEITLLSLALADRFRRTERESRVHRDASAAKSMFLANVSHEIRTPLNAILGMSELLSAAPLGEAERGYLAVQRRAGETLLALLNDVVDISRIESGRLELESVPFSPGILAEEAAAMLERNARLKGLDFSREIAEDLPRMVVGDPTRLRQILVNLISNAVKFSRDGGRVLLSVRVVRSDPTTSTLRFTVEDHGIGIPLDQHSRIFEAFSQGDETVTRRFGGSGLGLAICRELVTLMHGEMQLDSVQGRGSRFSVEIPFELLKSDSGGVAVQRVDAGTVDAGSGRRESSAGPPATGDTRPLRILLAEDNEDNRMLVEAYLKGSGHSLAVAENGEEAVKLCRTHRYDLILMDIQMPVLDGLSATREIRTLEQERAGSAGNPAHHLWIYALTAHALKEEMARSLEAGCDGHIVKPLKKTDLYALIERVGSQ